MVKIDQSWIAKIKQLTDGSLDDQKEACNLMSEKIRRCYYIDASVIVELLPIIVKFMESEDSSLQQGSLYFIDVITSTSNSNETTKENTKRAIKAGVLPPLVKLLSSTKSEVSKSCLICIFNITFYFSSEVVTNDALPSLIKCLKSTIAVDCIRNILNESRQYIPLIVKANGVPALIENLKSVSDSSCEECLSILTIIAAFNIETCQIVLNHGILIP
uniref:Uncharacterized protein n=1 Tax=Panagrolaimus sp. ES5 TaxID=591445 RepID=A0AC34GF76_9BILA